MVRSKAILWNYNKNSYHYRLTAATVNFATTPNWPAAVTATGRLCVMASRSCAKMPMRPFLASVDLGATQIATGISLGFSAAMWTGCSLC